MSPDMDANGGLLGRHLVDDGIQSSLYFSLSVWVRKDQRGSHIAPKQTKKGKEEASLNWNV